MLLTACTSMCAAAEGFFGPQVTEWIAIALGLVIGWLKLRKVQAAAQAGVVAAQEQARTAKAEAREARLSLARIEGSLRPSVSSIAPTLPPLKPFLEEGLTSASGTYQPVQWPPMPDDAPKPTPAELANPKLPRPSNVPREASDAETQPATPSAKKRQP